MNVDRENLARKSGEDCGLVSGARTHLEHPVAGGDFQQLGHVRDDVRLRDCLAQAYRQWAIVVGPKTLVGRNELMAWSRLHRTKNGGIADSTRANLPLYHRPPHCFPVTIHYFIISSGRSVPLCG